MKKVYLRLLIAVVTGNNDRIKAIRIFFLAFFFCCLGYAGYGNVTITPASGGTSICSNKAVGGSAAGFIILGTITVAEGIASDFSGPGTDVIVLNAPAGWQFNTAIPPTFGFASGANVTSVTLGPFTSSSLTVNIAVNGTTAGDQVFIYNLGVQATSSGAAAGYIYASSVTGVTGVTTGTSGSDFANLSLSPLVTPSITIAASPGSSICSGTDAVFTITASTGGGGGPTYQWNLNGSPVTTGITYASSSLVSGNVITCIMTSSAACITTNTVTSNTITMTVSPVPSAITGVAGVCPASTINLSDPTPSGSWSTGNTTIATVGVSGIVTGVTAGNALITYTVGSCSATTTVTVNNVPITPVLTPSTASVCNGSNITIIASGISTPPTVVSDNFNSAIAPWTVDNTGSVGTIAASAWNQYADASVITGYTFHSPDNSGFAAANADASGSLTITSTRLVSPVFSLVGYASATLTFQHSYEPWHADSTVELDISTDGGVTWTTLQNWLGTAVGTQTDFIPVTFPLTSYLGLPNLQIRFFYNSNWGYYWAIDNVSITGTSLGVVPTWSPVTFLFSDAGLTTPYTAGTPANTVYMYPTTVTSTTIINYTATASNFGCTSVGTNTITVYPAPAAIAGNTNVCAGLTSALSDAVTGGTWSSSNTSVATVVAGTGVVTGITVGSGVITYTLAGGCYVTAAITVNPLPSAISGTMNVCVGSTTDLSATPFGGAWSSSSLPVATVVSGTGIVTGVSTGTSVITYSLGAGCVSIASVTVNPVPSAIAGQTSVCTGSTITLSDGVSGGTWSCSNTGFATITSATGIFTGVSAGTATVTYSLSGSCISLLSITVYPLPTVVTGNTNVCQGLTTTLSDSPSGGVWTSSNTSVATITPGPTGGGVVTGVSVGTVNVTYAIGSSCIATTSVTVNALPSAISGTGPVCAGSSIPLSDVTASGTWSSSNTSVATVDPVIGLVTGASAGTIAITYTLGTGCVATRSVTVNPLPLPVTGINVVCIGLTTNLSDMSGGGTWSSSNTSVATIVAGSGFVSAISSGVSNMTYTLPTGCIAIQTVTVNSLPSAIYGTTDVCVGLTTTLSNAVSGGTWSSSNTGDAIVGAATGIVTGVNSGIVNITYTLGTSCIATTTLQVNPLSPVTGIANVCEGLTTNLSDATGGGTWSSSNTSFATVSGTGVVNGITANTITISYELPTGCTATASVVVNPIPSAISGNTNVCLSLTTTLSDGGGGTWSSSNTSVASIGLNNGIVLGLSTGTSPITYSLSAGCIATATVTVNPLPAAITGAVNVCVGSSVSLSDVTPGGTWSSSNTAFATAGAGGVVTGVSAGAVMVIYTLPTGCTSVKNITVNPLPLAISGIMNVCVGLTTTLSDATTSGTWSSSNTTIATITATGIVIGETAGTAVIAYGIGTGCAITTSVIVNPLPSAITGSPNICVGLGTTLSDVTGGGAWSSSNTAVATITASGSGIVTSVSPGTTNITYTLGTGCIATTTVTVNSLPSTISGTTTMCVGLNATLSDGGGGTWSSSNSGIATVVSTTGVVTGSSAGNANITFTLSTGCIATASVLVNPLPTAITGSLNVCNGFTTTLSDITAGGAWSSSNTSVATITVSGSGIITSISQGTTTIAYTLGTGCLATRAVTVNPLPNNITGTTTVCAGLTTALSDAGGGTWSSSNTTIATVATTTGIVTGVSAGNANITYTLPTGCIATTTVTVDPLPAAIVGSLNVCYSFTTSLSDATAGGAWSSSNTLIAGIDPGTGFVSTESSGTTTITYTLGTGCITTKTVTVNPLPSVIVGQANICVLSNAVLSDATTGGTWSSSNSAIATVGLSNGIVTGASAGAITITYTLNTGCNATKNITVNTLPPSISGAVSICLGSTSTLSDASSGGTWSSANTTVAIINSGTGLVLATSPGTSLITYVVDTGCAATVSVTVNSLPSPVSGAGSICAGQTTTLSDGGGGTWSSSNTSVATVGSSGGIVTGVSAGSVTIIYTLSTGCTATKNITVNAIPSAISGITSLCLGGTTTLSDGVLGGTWSSSNTNTAVIDVNTGLLAGGLPGTSTITYLMPGNCGATALVTVNTVPSGISGTSTLCVGLTTALTDGTTGGVWSSSNTFIATVSSTGIVTGLSAGAVTINYSLGTGCAASRNITVYLSPSSITGTANICLGSGTVLSDAVSGGAWSSSNTFVAMIDPVAGVVTPISPGSTVVTYSMPGGCAATVPLTVNAAPSGIIGSVNTCVGLSTALSDLVGGGTWSSSNSSVATIISGAGIVTGAAPGVVMITYSLAAGCITTVSVTVNAVPSSITGIANVCLGAATTLSDAVTGGTWSSSNTLVAPVNVTTGVVTGFSPGTATIIYSIVSGCSTVTSVTVDPTPSVIFGNTITCVGLTTSLSDAVAGGTWSSSNTAIATVTTTTGIVRGVTAGTVTITYSLAGGCVATTSVTIDPLPSAITGITNICFGSLTTLSDAEGGGTWSSSNTSVALIGTGPGVIIGLSPGTSTITYSIVSGCATTTVVTVNTLPGSITGTTTVCVGLTTHLSDGTAGGTWSSGNTSIATVITGTGVVTGVAAGTANIIYTLPTGCTANRNVTVSALPTSISGITNVCLGYTSTLSNGTSGGTWSSSNTSVATVDPALGIVSGVIPGSSTITYSLGAGCTSTVLISVISAPAVITGATDFCIGLTTSLSDATSGGFWSSSNTAIATVVPGTGHVSGFASGTVIITYSIGTGCAATSSVIVDPLPSAIIGNTNVCYGSITTLSDNTPGGTWSSSNTAVAPAGAGTGVITGLSPGTSVITYSLGAGCTVTASVSVNSLPSSVTGPSTVCIGLTTILSDATPGGTWSSGNTSVATIDPVAGIVYGVAPGNANIIYTSSTGCTANRNITVTSLPSAISGNTSICLGSATVLSDLVAGGTWSTANTAIASAVSGTGLVTGLSVGVANITYSLSAGCNVTASVTVMSLPPAITGATNVCIGSTATLSDAAGAGAWNSSNTAIGTIDPVAGIVSGIAVGNTIITYTAGTGCTITTSVTVDPLPSLITGAANVCVGSGTTLSDAGGGTWSSNNTSVATIGLSTGIFSGLTVGTSTITYTLGTGCITIATVAVIPLPLPITGTPNVCSGSATTLSDPASGGTWSSSNTTVAIIGLSSGVVTGALSGTSAIFYKLGTGCEITTTVTVNPLPSAISGIANVCVGATTTLSDAGSGTWSSSNSSVAAIGLNTGIVTGITAGPATITYTLSTGCIAVVAVTVNPLPSSITGITTVCAGSTTALSDVSSGGTWSSGNTTIATVITGSGIVSGITSGTAAIIYKLGTGCLITTTVNVNPLPSAISGTTAVCAGLVTTLSDSGGGNWSSSNTSVATVGLSTGVVSGVSAGTARITYTLGTGCIVTASVTVNPLPLPIVGATGVCSATTTDLSDATAPGTWSSSNTSVATITATSGIVSGLLPGSAMITYTIGTGCIITNTVTVYALPSAITGVTAVCAGSATTLSDAGGGNWSSSNTAVATIDPSAGIVSGLSSGTARITYALGTGCIVTASVTVDPLPSAITGLTNVCVGSATDLSDAGGGTWSSGNTGIATIGLTTGVVGGVATGAAMITYKLVTGCAATTTVTVNPVPSAISGITAFCASSSTILSDGISGGTWSSSNTGLATVGLANGLVTGVTSGSVNITYSLGGGCIVAAHITVEPVPVAISGSAHVCLGATTTLSDTPAGGVWSSDNTSVATIDPSSGIVTGVTPGGAIISYSLGTGCTVTFGETVNPVLPITGTTVVCAGETTNLSNALSGGTWSSNNTAIATVNSAGIVMGVSGGTATIIYTLPTGCEEAALVTVNPSSPITGTNNFCVGFTALLNDAVPGGTWSSSNTSVATISSSGLVSGIAVGATTINYVLATGCTATTTVMVSPIPAAITGNTTVCVGATTYLSDITGTGIWSNSSSFGILTINGITGAMTGLSAGTETVTYTSSAGCTATTTVTVQSPPTGISGPADICSGLTATFLDATFSGVWSTGNTTIATITPATGTLTAVSAGVTSVTYSIGAGCITIAAVTVDPTPLPISGATDVCAGGATVTVSDMTPGGSWTSAVVTISSTGLVTGYTTGTATVTYTMPTGCATITFISVDPLPSVITGAMDICPGVPSSLSDAAPGGAWSSGNTSVATIGAVNGIITGVAAGTVPVTYTNGAGCFVTALVTVHPLPASVSGNTTVCVASTTILSDASGGGTWSSGTAAIATTGVTTGIVTGVAAGVTTITYTLGTGCMVTASVLVNPLPIGITGVNNVCLGDPTTLSDYPLGGVWSSANTSIAVIGSLSGVVTGLSVNVTTITYTLITTGCSRTTPLTVNPLPPAITGAAIVCVGSAIRLSDASGGGVWGSGNTAVAAVSPGTGIVTGVSASSANIIYTLATGCTTTASVTVDPLPDVYNVTGGGTYCTLDSGVHIGLSSSDVGFNYELYLGSAAVGTLHGTGITLDFGLKTVAGTYIVVAVNNATGCSAQMSGNAVIIITPAVTPAVIITADTGYTVCTGTIGTFIATPVNGGTAPTYQWKVNGTNASTTNPYYYVPANGDIVTCTMTTSIPCVTAFTASALFTVTVTAYQTPSVTIAVTPGGTVCTGTPVTFIPSPVFGGVAPVYTWMRNGANIATGPSYSYTPANGDSLYCIMISDYPCVFTDAAWSNDISMSVAPLMSPSVTISAVPGTTIGQGQADTLTATVVNAGPAPLYQWYINGVAVTGATSATYSNSNFSNGDSVSCVVLSNGMCSEFTNAYVIIAVNNVGVTQITSAGGDILLVPNPNKGEFTIKGSLSGPAIGGGDEVSLEVTDMLGQVVYKDKIMATNGKINSHIILSGTLANGMYILNLHAASENRIFHFVIEQ